MHVATARAGVAGPKGDAIDVSELRMVRAWTAGRVQRARDRVGLSDRGEILQTVVIIGLFVAAAIIIVAIIVAKATSTANKIKTQ